MYNICMEIGEILNKAGIGGYYRRTADFDGVEIKGPFPNRSLADGPYAGARLPFPISVSSKFYWRRPEDVIPPEPIELMDIKTRYRFKSSWPFIVKTETLEQR